MDRVISKSVKNVLELTTVPRKGKKKCLPCKHVNTSNALCNMHCDMHLRSLRDIKEYLFRNSRKLPNVFNLKCLHETCLLSSFKFQIILNC